MCGVFSISIYIYWHNAYSVYQMVSGYLGSAQGRVIAKTQKMVLDASHLKSPLHFYLVAIEKGACGLPSTTVGQLTYVCMYVCISIYRGTYIYIYIYIYAYRCICICTYVSLYRYICVYIYMYICIYVYIHINAKKNILPCIYIYIYIYIYILRFDVIV